MSLQVWLPLNGTLENKGVTTITATGTSLTKASGGIYGSTYTFNGSSSCIKSTEKILGSATQLTLAMWVKDSNISASWHRYGGLGNHNRFHFDHNGTRLSMFVACNGDTTSNYNNRIYGPEIAADTWVHLCGTIDGTSIKFYVNGTLVASSTVTATPNSADTIVTLGTVNSGTLLSGSLADVRIYDNVLSQKEINDLAKGLCLHFPMNTLSGLDCLPNLALTHTMKNTVPGYYIPTDTTADYSIVNDVATESGWALKEVLTNSATSTKTIGRYWQYQAIIGSLSSLTSGDYYTVTVKMRASRPCTLLRDNVVESQTYIGTPGHSYSTNITLTTEYKLYSFTCKISTTSKFTSCFYISVGASSSVTVWIADYKLEKGQSPTGYVPNVADPAYRDYDSSLVPDESGAGNDGMSKGSLSLTSGSPRYRLATYFPSGSYIYPIVDPIQSNTPAFTISVWVCPATVSENQCIWNGRSTTGKAVSIFLVNNKFRFDTDSGSAGQQMTISYAISANTWYLATATWSSGGTKCFYINGVLKASETATSAAFGKSNTYASIGRSIAGTTLQENYFSGKMSDFRIYATALSATEVKALYNTSASMDNMGNMHIGEFVEDNGRAKPSLTRTGSAIASSLSELGILYDTRIYEEPDGSMWVRAFHHYKPQGNPFKSSDAFTTGVYGSSTRWFAMAICSHIDKWEIIYEQQETSNSIVERFRWIQYANPMTCGFNDTKTASITQYTSSDGYTDPPANYGGMYKNNGNTYLCCNNNVSGNWMGAVGMWNQGWQSGSNPSYGKAVSTGYVDVYVRIDNVTISDCAKTCFSMNKGDASVSTSGLVEI